MEPGTELVEVVYPWVAAIPGPCPIVGINGPQGAGKTTLVTGLVRRAAAEGRRWAAVSIDDFYRTRAEQEAIAQEWPDDPLAQVRGPPGSHDIGLGVRTLEALRRPQGEVAVPAYDKAAHGGRGDRRPTEEWPRVALPVERILLEGWLLGFPPVGAGGPLARVDPLLEAYRPWLALLAGMVQLRTSDPETVVRWRVEAEARMRATGRGGMSDREAEAYIRRFVPFYETYPEAMVARPPVPGRHLVLWLGSNREILEKAGSAAAIVGAVRGLRKKSPGPA